MGNPDKRLKKIIILKNSQLKSLTLLTFWLASFLCVYFPYPARFEPFLRTKVLFGLAIKKSFLMQIELPGSEILSGYKSETGANDNLLDTNRKQV